MFIDVDAKIGDVVITETGTVGWVSEILVSKDGISYNVSHVKPSDRGYKMSTSKTVFTQTWEYRGHVEKQARSVKDSMMETAQAVCDEFMKCRADGDTPVEPEAFPIQRQPDGSASI